MFDAIVSSLASLVRKATAAMHRTPWLAPVVILTLFFLL